jgi:hypothetical protein
MAVINNANFSSSEVASTVQSPSGNGIDQGEPTEPLTMTIKFLPQNNNAYHKINNAIHIVIHHSGTHPLLLLIPTSLRELVRVVVLIPLVSYIVVTTLVVFIVIQNRHLCGARFMSTLLERVAIVSSGGDVAICRNKCQHSVHNGGDQQCQLQLFKQVMEADATAEAMSCP